MLKRDRAFAEERGAARAMGDPGRQQGASRGTVGAPAWIGRAMMIRGAA
jgi:hypothetical protein